MLKFILNVKDNCENILLAARAAKYLEEHPNKEHALMQYGEEHLFFVKRNKNSISVWEQ